MTHRGVPHGVNLRSGLHQVAPRPGTGSVVGGPERFTRVALDVPVAPRLADRTGLTPRDIKVLGLLAEGWTTADIAHELAYAESTIKKEVHLIVHRLGARNRTHAVAMAIRGSVI